MNSTFFAIAWRGIWRNKRRSFLTVSMISFGLMLSILMLSMTKGSGEEVFRVAIETNVGSLQIHAKDYEKNKTLTESFRLTPEIKTLLEQDAELKSWAPRIMGGGMVSVGEQTQVAAVMGIDPQRENTVSILQEKMLSPAVLHAKYPELYPTEVAESRYLSSSPQMQAIIGDRLAEKLEARIGEDLVVMVQGADGSTGAQRYTLVGVYHSGFAHLDNGIYLHIQDADALFSLYGKISLLAVNTLHSKAVPEIVARFRAALDPAIYEVMGWDELIPDLVEMMELKGASNTLMVTVLFVIIAFGVLNTVFLTIMERIKEFGILKALGMTPVQVFSLVLYETFFLALMGIGLGNLLGGALSYYLKANPIDVSAMAETYEEMGFNFSRLPAAPEPSIFIYFSLLIFALSMVAALYPGLKAARLEPLDAMKHT